MIEVENIQKWVCRGVDSRFYVASNRLFYYPITILFFSVTVFRFLLLVNSIFVGGIETVIAKFGQRLLVTNRLGLTFPLVTLENNVIQ